MRVLIAIGALVFSHIVSAQADAREIRYVVCGVSDFSQSPTVLSLTQVIPLDTDTLEAQDQFAKELDRRFVDLAAQLGHLGDGVYARCSPWESEKAAIDSRASRSDDAKSRGWHVKDLPATGDGILNATSPLTELTCTVTAVSTPRIRGAGDRLAPRDWSLKFFEAYDYVSISNEQIFRLGDLSLDFSSLDDVHFDKDSISFCPKFYRSCGDTLYVSGPDTDGTAVVNRASINRRNGAFEWSTSISWNHTSIYDHTYTGTCAPAAPPRF